MLSSFLLHVQVLKFRVLLLLCGNFHVFLRSHRRHLTTWWHLGRVEFDVALTLDLQRDGGNYEERSWRTRETMASAVYLDNWQWILLVRQMTAGAFSRHFSFVHRGLVTSECFPSISTCCPAR